MALKIIPSNAANAYRGFRPHWYGQYKSGGQVTTFNLGVLIRGEPPASGYIGDKGDETFEASRKRAEEKFAAIRSKGREKGEAVREVATIVKMKTGRKFIDPALADLADIYLDRLGDRSTCHVAMIRSGFSNFAAFAASPVQEDAPDAKRIPKAKTLLEVTPELATAFFHHIADDFAFSTVKRWSNLLTGAFDRLAPVGMANPFKGARLAAVGRAATKRSEDGEKVKVETVVHHRPIDRAQLRKLYAAAKDDPLLYALTVAAASTGLRIGDACTLEWKDIHLTGNQPIIFLTTQKTGARVAVPIFHYLADAPDYEPDLGEFRRILEAAFAEAKDGEKYVFPQAARLYLETKKTDDDGNPLPRHKWTHPGRDVIYSRGKALFAKALFSDDAELVTPDDGEKPAPTTEHILAAIDAASWTDERQGRVRDIYTRHANGESYLTIQTATGYAKSTISTDLAAVEVLVGAKVKARPTKPSVRAMLKHTRQERAAGKRAASLYSWHSLRGSFVVLMRDNGVPLDTVRELVGHTTCDQTLQYFNPTQKLAAESARRILTRRNRTRTLTDAAGTRTVGAAALLPPPTADAPRGNLDALRAALAALSEAERAQLLKGI